MVLHAAQRAGMRMTRLRTRSGGLRLPAHEATTAQIGVAYPFAATAPLPVARVLVGRDLAGGRFCHDPFDLYASGMLTNPNITILGQIGRGKSALVKSYLYRQHLFGRRVAVLDPKGEYRPLAAALGTEPIRLSPRGGTRINPLAPASEASMSGEKAAPDEVRRQRLALLATLAEATMHRRLLPTERLALEVALVVREGETGLGIADVVEEMLRPGAEAARLAGSTVGTLTEDGRFVGLELRRLVLGDLAGMFDGRDTPGSAAGQEALVVDLSDVYHAEALPALMVCAAAWLQSMTAHASARTLFVVDEAWAVLSDLAVARYLRSSWKLARARGLANVAVCHRASDLANVGNEGSEAARLAEGLMADSETVICYAQPASELVNLAVLLGCSQSEIDYLPSLRRGVALWRVGGRRYLVEHLLSREELAFVDTDDRMRTAGAAAPGQLR